jgi:hypothetical protein
MLPPVGGVVYVYGVGRDGEIRQYFKGQRQVRTVLSVADAAAQGYVKAD